MTDTANEKRSSPWRSPWVIGWIGLILVFLVANFVMIFFAIDSNPGLVVEDYYERGQNYERTLVSKMARDPGWKMNLDRPDEIVVDQSHTFRFLLVDKAGQPVSPDKVTLFAYRPSDAAQDFQLDMEQEAQGRYRVDASFPLIGVWDLLVSVRMGEDEYHLGERISVQRP